MPVALPQRRLPVPQVPGRRHEVLEALLQLPEPRQPHGWDAPDREFPVPGTQLLDEWLFLKIPGLVVVPSGCLAG